MSNFKTEKKCASTLSFLPIHPDSSMKVSECPAIKVEMKTSREGGREEFWRPEFVGRLKVVERSGKNVYV